MYARFFCVVLWGLISLCTIPNSAQNVAKEYTSKNCTKETLDIALTTTTYSTRESYRVFCFRWKIWKGCLKYRTKMIEKTRTKLKKKTIQTCCPGWKEVNSTICVKACEEGNFGDQCQNLCNCSENGNWMKGCDRVSGKCHCAPGYTGDNCTEDCQNGFYGSGCNMTCHCQNNSTCGPVNGTCNCTSPGWKGTFCEEACDNGMFGVGCKNECGCPKNSTCNHINGNCTCSAGLRGKDCSEECEKFTFGEDCGSNCNCNTNNTESCDPVTGVCNCKSGWTGLDCTSSCDGQTYGSNCARNCSCSESHFCDPQNGTCYGDVCHAIGTENCAYETLSCPEQPLNTSYDNNITTFLEKFFNLCNKLTNLQHRDVCLAEESCRCSNTSHGEHCLPSEENTSTSKNQPLVNTDSSQTSEGSTGIVAGVSGAAVVVTLLVVIVILYMRGRNQRQTKTVHNNTYALSALQINEDIITGPNMQSNEIEEETYDKMDRNGSAGNQQRKDVTKNNAVIEDTYSHATSGADYDTMGKVMTGSETDNEYSVTGRSSSQDVYNHTTTDNHYDTGQGFQAKDVAESAYSSMRNQMEDNLMSQDNTYDRSENYNQRASSNDDIDNYD